ncbi:MAG: hypothetical protein EPN82_07315 [Bacteroidetes bacterium]|nr:MAG: hypothetical protein EPN82_07315 [Bacteroidota bacterium]
MKLISKLLIVVFSFIIILSCTKDNITNPQQSETMADYMPLTIGSWWKYEYYDIDPLGTRYNKRLYTYYVSDIQVIAGIQAFNIAIKTENPDTTVDGMLFYAIKNGKFLQYLNYPEFIEKYGWIVYADFNSEQWALEDTLIIKDSTGMHCETHYTWIFKKGGQRNYQIKGMSIQAQEFVSEEIWISNDLIDGYKYNDTLKFIIHTWYGKNVGIIHQRLNEINSLLDVPSPSKAGKEFVLIDYEIK